MLRVIVVGGGIGGLAAALALRKEGFDPVVLEQAPALTPVGSGIGLGANAMRALDYLGGGDAIRGFGIINQEWIYRSLADGRGLRRLQTGRRALERYGEYYYSFPRYSLVDAMTALLPAEHVRLNAKVVHIEQDAEGVRVALEDGSTIKGDALIGADGWRSIVRSLVVPIEPEAIFSGFVAWRTIVPNAVAQEAAGLRSLMGWIGDGRFLVVYPVSETAMNLSAYVPAAEVQRESWTDSGDVADLRRSFSGVCSEARDIIGQVENAFLTGIYVRDPIPRWAEGRAAVLGDAAHPMGPFSGNGGALAIEDAVMLAICLRRAGGDVAQGLADYSLRRVPRGAKAMTAARARIVTMRESDPKIVAARNGRMRGVSRLDPSGEVEWAWLYRFDPIAEAERSREMLGAEFNNPLGRAEARKAFDLWRGAIVPRDRAAGWLGERAAYARFLAANFPAPVDIELREIDCDGVSALMVIPPGGLSGPPTLHLHGGAYTMGSAHGAAELAGRLARATGGWALVPDYRLAPEYPYPAALEDALTAYRWLAARNEGPILVSGECAGGALGVALAQRLRANGERLPAALHAVSPFADLSLGAASIETASDPWLNREVLTELAGSYIQDADPRAADVSPLFGDLSGLPPLLIQAAAGEALRDDAKRLAAAGREMGVDVTLEVYPDSVHSFVLFPALEDAAKALASWSTFSARHLGKMPA